MRPALLCAVRCFLFACLFAFLWKTLDRYEYYFLLFIDDIIASFVIGFDPVVCLVIGGIPRQTEQIRVSANRW